MKLLKPVRGSYLGWYLDISNSKRGSRKGRLLSKEEFIKSKYFIYSRRLLNNEIELIKVEILTNQEKEDFKHCYKYNTIPLIKLKREIINTQIDYLKNKCQYCGYGYVNVFDHYLPQAHFAEYSVYGVNLIPCCFECNLKKGELFIKDDSRLFINYYYDDIIEREKILYCDINIDEERDLPTFEFYLDLNDNISGHYESIIGSHFDELDLLKRYKDISHGVFSEIERILIAYSYKFDIKDISGWLQSYFNVERKQKGINHYKVAILDELKSNEDYLHYITRKIR